MFRHAVLFFLLITIRFGVLAQTGITFSATQIRVGEFLEVSVQGYNTHFSPGFNTLEFYSNNSQTSNIRAQEIYVAHKSFMRFLVQTEPNTALGEYQFKATNVNDILLQGLHSFWVIPDTIPAQLLSAYPDTLHPFAAQSLMIRAKGTHFYQYKDSLSISVLQPNVIPHLIKVIDDTHLVISCNIPTNYTGPIHIQVNNPKDGLLTQYNAAWVSETGGPRIISVIPNKIVPGEICSLRVNGHHTYFSFGRNDFTFNPPKFGPSLWFRDKKVTLINDSTIDLLVYFDKNDPLGWYNMQVYTRPFYTYMENAFELISSYADTLSDQNLIQVFPNPSKDQITINSAVEPIESLSLYTLEGKEILLPNLPPKTFSYTLPIASYVEGNNMYLLAIKSVSAIHYQKIFIK